MYEQKGVLGFMGQVLNGLFGGWIVGYFGSAIIGFAVAALFAIATVLITAVCSTVTFGHYLPHTMFAIVRTMLHSRDQFFTFCVHTGNVLGIAFAILFSGIYLIWGPGAIDRYMTREDTTSEVSAV